MLDEAIAIALEALSWMDLRGLSEREALYKSSKQLKIKKISSLKLAHSFIIEVNRRLNYIDNVIETLSSDVSTDHKTILGVENFLRIYVHWILFRNSSIKEAKIFLKSGRRVIGWKELLPYEYFFGKLLGFNAKYFDKRLSDVNRIGLKTYHPIGYVKYLFKNFGRQETLRILRRNMEKPVTYIRVNTLREHDDEIIKKLTEEGIRLVRIDDLKYVYRVIKSKNPLTKLNSYKRGLFQIQDKSSSFSILASDPKPGHTVLDLCSAPGSKTSFLAQIMENTGVIYSIDNSIYRMWTWRKEIERLGVKIAEPIIADAKSHLPINVEADLVLVDPPCSGTGIFMKIPSMKWQIDFKKFKRYSNLQFEIIRNAAKQVKPGGTLAYSTCSITLEENEILIERFLRICPNFKLVDTELAIGSPGLRGLKECMRLYPHKHDCLGFFYAKMTKI